MHRDRAKELADWRAYRKPRNQRQQRAGGEEDHAGDDGHVIAGDVSMAKNMEYLNGLTLICFPLFGIGKQLDDCGRQPPTRLCYRYGAYRSDTLGHRTLAGSLGTARRQRNALLSGLAGDNWSL